VSGEPGCGKSTRIPEFVLLEESNSGKRVASAQPNKMAITLLADRVATKLDCEVGSRVGYNIPGDDKTTDETLLEFTTAEKLLWKLHGDGMLSKYVRPSLHIFCFFLHNKYSLRIRAVSSSMRSTKEPKLQISC
jgi:HrpA-like RNA helicase